jgi:hypothetical protein
LTATGAAVDFVFDKQHPWSFEDMIHTVLTIVALKKGKFLQKVSPEEMIVIKKKFEYVDKDGKKVVKNKTIEFVRQLDPSKIAKSYTETKSQIRSKN